jgi:hypothetical protein
MEENRKLIDAQKGRERKPRNKLPYDNVRQFEDVKLKK